MIESRLLTEFLRVYTFQPATALWRAVEIGVLRQFIPDSEVALDLGCGDGKLTALLMKEAGNRPTKLIGMDADGAETQHAANIGLYERVHTCRADRVPEASGSFDLVLSNSVLEHIEDIEPVIAEVSRLLSTDGNFVFTVPSSGFHDCIGGPLWPGTPRSEYLRQLDSRLAHYRYWTIGEWRLLLAQHHLVVERHAEYLSLAEVRRWENISRLTAGVLYSLLGGRRQPIEIQRRLGLRTAQNHAVMPRWFARVLAFALAAGLPRNDETARTGCLVVSARKQMTAEGPST